MKEQTELVKKELPKELAWIDKTSTVLDDIFKIPATNIRFGLDPLIGLIPVVGDFVGFAISASMVLAIVRHGVSLSVLMKILGNITFDYLVGLFPFLGDFLDVAYKSNRRNVDILKDYYTSGKHTESSKYVVWFAAIGFLVLLTGFVGGTIYATWLLLSSLLGNV
ncbi:MAG: DUF4112 domain-containing protein [Flexibacter sp. CG_4_10_14_3_um_filter_32_15]|nr:MAG: DUF4112 domain-containing protein [Flexibacter sp. CG_4_10_14_3_um_filter_32_15]